VTDANLDAQMRPEPDPRQNQSEIIENPDVALHDGAHDGEMAPIRGGQSVGERVVYLLPQPNGIAVQDHMEQDRAIWRRC